MKKRQLIDTNIEMTEIFELSDNNFKAAMLKMFQQTIIIMPETNEKMESLNADKMEILNTDKKGTQLHTHKFDTLEDTDHFLKKKRRRKKNLPQLTQH